MARPQVADEGDGLQIWKVSANVVSNIPLSPGKSKVVPVAN
jgi:hypothetical protein